MSSNQLTDTQIAAYASQAGFTANALVIAIAVCLAESRGVYSTLHLNSDGTWDRGLWQINSVHTQYDANRLLTDPLYNAQAAYALSSGGRNWGPWTTYNTGEYQQYIARATTAASIYGATKGTTPPPVTGAGSGGIQPWYTFKRVDNLGTPDPFGGFPKPDSNIQLPAGYPVTALLPGTVSGVDTSSSWGASITIRLDQPLNALADHTSYLHLRCDLQARPGQHVGGGQLIGYNGSSQACGSQKVPLGFALYHGDNYGVSDGWQYMTVANLTGNGALNPVPLLNAAAAGQIAGAAGLYGGLSGFGLGGTSFGPTKSYVPLTEQIHETLIDTPGFYGIALALDEAEQFPGFIDLTQSEVVDLSFSEFGIQLADMQLPVPDVSGGVRSIGATITDNFTPAAIRGGLVLLGVFMFVMLFAKAISGPVSEILPEAMEAFS
jgi:murein DD-endopeptidase MepM/ murein hydrolase activator NlpD